MSSDVPPHSNTITTLSPISGMDSFKPSASSSTNSYFQLKASRAEPSAKLQSLADVTASGPNSPVPYDHQLPSQIQKDDSFQLSLMAISDISLDVGDEPLLGERSSSHADKPELTTSGSTPRHGEDAESGTIAQVLHNNETSQNARIFTSSATVDPSPTLFSRYARGGSCASEFSLQVQLGSTPDVVPSLGIKKPSRQSETLSSSSLISKDIRTLPPGASVNSGEQALPTRVFLPSERRSTTVLVESGLSRGKTRRRSSLTSDSGVEDTVRRMSTVDLRARRLSACSMQVHDGIESGSMSVCQGDSVKKRSSVGRKSTAGSRVQGRGSVINVAEPAEALSPGKGKDQKGSQRLVQLAVPQEPLIPKTSSEVAVTSESILPPPSPSNSSHHLFNKLLSRCRTLFIDPIHPESTHPKLWMAWKTLIFFAHIIAIILTPLQMGWSHYILSLTRIALGQVLFDVILFIDAYLDARVVFDQDGDGNFCWDGKEIWRRFAYSNFGLGRLLLSLPFQLVAYRVSIPENWFRVYGLNVENTLT
ncbi:hypothetical protein BC829DRAFT_28513 [Chytridium lagenaria]|nr:hypothetical protein BC829DRAFT_28513 [Chytridium lagenaria]